MIINRKVHVIFLFVFVCLSFAAALFGTGDTETKHQWKIDDLLTTDRVSEYNISPDGKWLAWTVSKWNLKEQKTYNIIYLTPLKEKGEDIQLTRGEDRFSSIRWVPGKDQISFKTGRKFKKTETGNLWVMSIKGGEPYPVTNFKKGLQQYDWLDKDNLLFTSREVESLYEKEKKDKKDTSEVVEDEEHRIVTRLFKYNLKDKKVTRLTDNVKPLQGFSLSHDKKMVIYNISMSMLYRQDEEIRPNYYLMDLESKETREIFADKSLKPYGRFSWALDNSGFYAPMNYSTHPKYTMAAVMKLYWYDINSHQYREIDLDWDKYGGRFEVTQDGIVMGLPNGVHFKYARYYKKGTTWKRTWIKGETQKNISSINVHKDSKTMIYSYSTASLPRRYYLAQLKGNRFVKKSEIMDIKSPLFKRPLAKSEIIRWQGAMDDIIEGILYYPYKYEEGKKYPLIVMIHGGPNGADMDFFRDRLAYPAHLMSERGAFSLKVNYHGSSNYGIEFGESIAGHYYEYEVPDIEKGVDYLIAQGKVDEEKLGIIGWSNGAILGTALTIHTNRYKVASLGAGDVNWTSDYGNCAFGVAFDNYYFGGPPWERVEHYIKKSPLFQLHKVTTPTLIFHGTNDRAVPYEQGWEYYRALKVLGKAPVRFISFPGEGHGPRKLAHQRRKLSEEIKWFEKYLFKTLKEKNEALKRGSPLDLLAEYQKIAKVNGAFGLDKNGILIPEVVEYKKKLVGRFEVTREQWACFDKNYKYEKGTENIPVTGVDFKKAVKYTAWLTEKTGDTYRLPNKDESKTLYANRSGNTLDYWAGYTLSPGDYNELLKELKKFGEKPVLLKPAGSFKPAGKTLVFDLGGNAAEWIEIEKGKGKTCGGSAERPVDDKSLVKARAEYTGLRVIKEINNK